MQPSKVPSNVPTQDPTSSPSLNPSHQPSEAPTSDPTVQPSASPSECVNNEDYVSPVFPDFGCELYLVFDCRCDAFNDFMTDQEIEELFTNCRSSCVCGPHGQATTEGGRPDCTDSPDYQSPINGEGCDYHFDLALDCYAFYDRGLLTLEELTQLLTRCPRSCNLCY